MSTTWRVTSITANPDFACLNSAGVITLPRKQIVWDPPNDNIDNSYIHNDGSSKPVAFRTPQVFNAPNVPIEVTGRFNFPESWMLRSYTVSAMLGGSRVLESERTHVPRNGSDVKVTNFSLVSSNPSAAAIIPFRLSGDFSWWISLVTSPTLLPEILEGPINHIAINMTRLELCWARSAAPDGPKEPTSTRPVTRVNLSPGYPIALFRLFSPNLAEFSHISSDSILEWYIARAMRIIWEWPNNDAKPRYDVENGASGYGMTVIGGKFQLTEWMKRQADKVNCYDLAAISQLACAILVDENGDELLDSRWVYQSPNGYINPGPLYGWNKVIDGKNHMGCNNPFWGNKDYYPNPDAPHSDTKRSLFSTHVWVEINPGNKVLDACHASTLYPNPDAGTRNRDDYFDASIDHDRTPRGNTINSKGRHDYVGKCFLNPYFQPERLGVIDASGHPGVAITTTTPFLEQGVPDKKLEHKESSVHLMKRHYSLSNNRSINSSTGHPNMDPGPSDNPSNAPIGSLGLRDLIPLIPPNFISHLEDTLERGKHSHPSEASFNNAPVHPDALIRLFSSDPIFNPQSTISVTPSATRLQIAFEHPGPENLENIHLTLDVFNSFDDAICALISHLMTFPAENMRSIIKPLDNKLGNFSYRTSDSIFWVRGNQVIRIQESKKDPFASPGAPTILKMATTLDDYLGSDTDRHASPPNVSFGDSDLHPHIPCGQSYNVTIKSSRNLLETKDAFCDNSNILLPVGATPDGGFEFFAVNSGKTQIHVCVADAITLRPAEVTVEVEVGPDED